MYVAAITAVGEYAVVMETDQINPICFLDKAADLLKVDGDSP